MRRRRTSPGTAGRSAGRVVGAIAAEMQRERGVDLRCGVPVTAPGGDSGGRLRRAHLSDGCWGCSSSRCQPSRHGWNRNRCRRLAHGGHLDSRVDPNPRPRPSTPPLAVSSAVTTGCKRLDPIPQVVGHGPGWLPNPPYGLIYNRMINLSRSFLLSFYLGLAGSR
jgi:hypothetical protein